MIKKFIRKRHIFFLIVSFLLVSFCHFLDAEWSIQTVDSTGVVGEYTSIAVDSNNYPYITYYDNTNGDLKYAQWDGSSWQIQTVDSTGNVGFTPYIEIDSNGNPHISYATFNGGLKYVQWDGTSWQIQTVDSTGNAGWHCPIALDINNNPHISYNGGSLDLKYAKWTGSVWDTQTIAELANTSSIMLDSNGNPHISYYDSTWNLKYALWNGSSWQIQTVDSEGGTGFWNSISIDANDNPHISYSNWLNAHLKYAQWDGSSWQIQTVDSTGYVGIYNSMVLDTNSNPHISYYDKKNDDLKYAQWIDSAWNIQTIDSSGNVGEYTSIALDSNNNPHISYYDNTNGDLKYAEWVPLITVVSPNGGERLQGTTHEITWTSSGNWNVKILYSDDGGQTYAYTIVDNTDNDGSYVWNMKDLNIPNCRIKIQSVDEPLEYDVSDESFVVGSSLIPQSGEVKIQGGLKGYVNPSQGEIVRIHFKAAAAGTVDIKIYTMRGQLVWETSVQTDGNPDLVSWDCRNTEGSVVSSDVYMIYIKCPGIKTTKNVAIVR